jgi:hypothetical protein
MTHHMDNPSRQESMALAALLPLLLDVDAERAVPARLAAEDLLARMEGRDPAWIEQTIRAVGYQSAAASASMGTSWRMVDPADLPRLCQEPGGGALVKLTSFHPNGFVRATAVRLLDAMSDGRELPFLLVRCNDWVPAVQQAAAAAVERRLMSTYAGHFFASASLGDHLLELRRNKLDGLHERVQSLLRSPSARAAREAALDSDDRQVRRAAFRLSADCGGDVRGLLLRALCCDDLWVRLWAVRLARARLYGPALREVLAQARGDRSVPVRREALLGLKDDPLELLQSLFDPSRGVRDMVCFYLRNKTHLDLASLYRQEVTRLAALGAQPRAGAQLATALYGLSETGSAVQALGRRMLLVGESALWRAFQEQRSPQCRLYLIGALASLPRWTSVRCLLRASGDPDPAVAAETQARLVRWTAAVNTTRPTSEELATVHALSTRASLGRPLLQDLLSVLQPWNSSARQ